MNVARGRASPQTAAVGTGFRPMITSNLNTIAGADARPMQMKENIGDIDNGSFGGA